MNALTVALCFVLLADCALAQSENSLNLDTVKQQLPDLNLDEATLPKKEEVEKALKEKCDKNGGAGTYDDIVATKDKVQECLQAQVNQTVIMAELDEAKKDGSMDDVFGKYCKKRASILDCVWKVTDKVEKCLEPQEKESMKMVVNITEKLIDFVCFKDGDRLAMFVAEGGFECLQDHKDALQECANKTLSTRLSNDISLTNLPMFTFNGDSQCADMTALQECAVQELEKCENNTPANIVEALFKFIRSASPCKDFKQGRPQSQRKSRTSQLTASVTNSKYVSDASAKGTEIIGNKVKRSQGVDFTTFDSFRDKCNKFAGPAAFHDLSLSVNETKLCIQTLLRQPNACELLITDGKRCIGRTLTKLRVCLPPQESYLPAFAMASVDNGLNYLCKNKAANYNLFLNGLPCMISNQYGHELSACMANTKTHRTPNNPTVSKQELCEDLDKVKLCLHTYISNRCAQTPQLKEVTMGLLEAVKDPCAGCSIYSNILLLISALVFYFFTRNN